MIQIYKKILHLILHIFFIFVKPFLRIIILSINMLINQKLRYFDLGTSTFPKKSSSK